MSILSRPEMMHHCSTIPIGPRLLFGATSHTILGDQRQRSIPSPCSRLSQHHQPSELEYTGLLPCAGNSARGTSSGGGKYLKDQLSTVFKELQQTKALSMSSKNYPRFTG